MKKLNWQWRSWDEIILKIQIMDGDHQCTFCHTKEQLTVDHIKPISLGGSREKENLQVLCAACNSKKGSIYPFITK